MCMPGHASDLGDTVLCHTDRVHQGGTISRPFTCSIAGLANNKLDRNICVVQIGFTKVVLHPEASNGASLDKWKEVMKKENDSMVCTIAVPQF